MRTPRHRPRPLGRAWGLSLALALGLASTLDLAVAGPAGAASRQAAHRQAPRLQLVGQTSWVTPGQPFVLDLAAAGRPSQLQVTVVVFDRLHSRSAFDQTLRNEVATYPLDGMGPMPLASLPPAPDHRGAVQLSITVASPGHPPPSSLPSHLVNLGQCGSSCAGVYPVRVSLESVRTGEVLDQLTTDLIFADRPTMGHRLDLAWVLSLRAPPRPGPGGRLVLPASKEEVVDKAARDLARYSGLPLTLAPSPDTLAALAGGAEPTGRSALAQLRTWAAQPFHEVAALPYAPVSPAALAAQGLGSQLRSQVRQGKQVVASTLGVTPDTTTWLGGRDLDRSGLSLVRSLPGSPPQHLLLPDAALTPLAERITPAQPFQLRTGRRTMEAMTADAGLAAHLADARQPVLASHQLLADLAMIYLDRPDASYTRGVVLYATEPGLPDPTILGLVLGALAHSPMIRPVTLDQFFTQVRPATVYGVDLVRQLAPTPSPPPRLEVGAIRGTEGRLASFISALALNPARVPVVSRMTDLVLESESTYLSPAQRQTDLRAVVRLIDTQASRIRLPTESVTLTARSGQLPVTIVSRAPYPVRGLLEVRSDGLSFPTHQSSRQPVTLAPLRSTPTQFDVSARAPGKFTVQVSLLSPRGHLVLVSSRFSVRSSAFSAVAIGLTVAAGLVLALWWGLSLLRGRRARNRRLVPAGE
jgi:hypothetical protein